MTLEAFALILIAMLVGGGYPIQAGVNATLAGFHGHPLLAALTNTAVASTVLVLVIVALQVPLPQAASLFKAPWWAWTGGLLGATFVFSSLVIAPKLGAAAFVSAGIVGTMATSLLIDHYGIIGYRPQPITWLRIFGAILVVAGMVMLNWRR